MNEWVWSVDGMVLKVETRSILTASCPIATWFTTDLTRTGPGMNPRLRSDRPRTNSLNHIEIQAMSVCLSTFHNIDTNQVASSGTASDVLAPVSGYYAEPNIVRFF